jgi:hypothetical protein
MTTHTVQMFSVLKKVRQLRNNRGGHSLAAATLHRDLPPYCIFIPLSDALPRCQAPRVTPIMQIQAKTCAKETLKPS